MGLLVGHPLGRLLVALLAAIGLAWRGTQDHRLWVAAVALLVAGVVQAIPWTFAELGFQFDFGRARCARLMGEAEFAMERCDRAMARARLEAALADAGPMRPVLAADSADRLADLAIADERATEAARWLEEALRSGERVPGPDAPRTRVTRDRLAELCGRIGEHERAVALLRQQVESFVRREGAESGGAAGAQVRLGEALAASRSDDEAETSLLAAVAVLERLNGAHHWSLAEPLLALAAIEGRRGRPGEAEARLRRALESASMAGQTELANRARAALVDHYIAVGRPAEAVPLSEARLRSMESGPPEDRARAADMLERHARLLELAGDANSAGRYARRAGLLRAALGRGSVR